MSAPAVEYVTGRYLGYRLEIGERVIHVYAPSGRWIGTTGALSSARRMVRVARGGRR